MFSLKAFFVPKVIRFVLITVIRIVGIVAMLLVISAEIWEMVRNIQGYAADVKLRHEQEASAALNNSTSQPDLCGYVMATTVPDHAGGIFFSTFFRFLNVIVLFFLLVSEISLPIPAIYNFYLRNFPPLSEDASLGFLGAAMMWIATSVLSKDVASFAMTSAWILFIMGFLNVLLGVIAGSSARETRSVFVTDKSKRDILPTTSSSKQNKKGKGADPHISYPAPMNIGFPAPAAVSKSSLGLGSYNTAGGAADLGFYMSPHAAVSRPSLSETVERRAVSPMPASNIHRSRSGKGVVTIKTDVEEIDDVPKPPSYAHGPVV